MSLHQIVRVKGGDLYAAGHRASIPGPGHSKADRSASLLIGRSGKVIAYSFGRSTPREILDDLRTSGLVDDQGFPVRGAVPLHSIAPTRTEASRVVRAEDIWSDGVPLDGTLSARHLSQHRAIERGLAALHNLRHHPCCPIAIYAARAHATRPALMARVQGRDGRTTAVEVTYLDAAGRRDARVKLSRKTIGVLPPGSSVPLASFDDTIVVAEGVMTALSAGTRFGLPPVALLSIRNLVTFMAPARVRHVVIAADRGSEGESAAAILQQRLLEAGCKASVELPRLPFNDFNQWAQAEKEEGEGSGLRAEFGNGPVPALETLR